MTWCVVRFLLNLSLSSTLLYYTFVVETSSTLVVHICGTPLPLVFETCLKLGQLQCKYNFNRS